MERDRTSIGRGEEGDGDSISGRRGGGVKYPDSHQLFVGNLPHNITERELKVFFGRKYALYLLCTQTAMVKKETLGQYSLYGISAIIT